MEQLEPCYSSCDRDTSRVTAIGVELDTDNDVSAKSLRKEQPSPYNTLSLGQSHAQPSLENTSRSIKTLYFTPKFSSSMYQSQRLANQLQEIREMTDTVD